MTIAGRLPRGLRTLLFRLEGFFWDHSPWWRAPARRLRLRGSLLRHRWRFARGNRPTRVVYELLPGSPGQIIAHPAVSWPLSDGTTEAREAQTERSWISSPGEEPPPYLLVGEEPETWPANVLESLLLVAAATGEGQLVRAGWAAPSREALPSGGLEPMGGELPTLYPLPRPSVDPRTASTDQPVGRLVRQISNPPAEGRSPAGPGLFHDRGFEIFRAGGPSRAVVRCRLLPIDRRLASLPVVSGPRTVLVLLPFLAIGGAERLLIDLLPGLVPRYRVLVVTLEPHRQELGQTVDAVRAHTPHVYTLGDWLPREAHPSALAHLLRRYQVESLLCWNACVAFFDLVPRWRQTLPGLRILLQLYNHEGGWIRRISPARGRQIDVHLAVNRPIVRALAERGAPPGQIALVHHGVAVPAVASEVDRREARLRARASLGLPADALVVGTFVRLHPQKRPFDVLATARRLQGEGFHFLLVGGGPLEEAIDRELARRPVAHLTRLPFRRDLDLLYSAVDLCLSTSAFEGLPIFLLDALARGIPCVSTAVGEIPLLLQEGGGRLVERPGDTEALAEGLRSLADPEVRRREGAAGRATVAGTFGLDAYRRRYEPLIFPPREEES